MKSLGDFGFKQENIRPIFITEAEKQDFESKTHSYVKLRSDVYTKIGQMEDHFDAAGLKFVVDQIDLSNCNERQKLQHLYAINQTYFI